MAIYRQFGLVADSAAGGSSYDDLSGTSYIIPDPTLFWPVTGGRFDRNVERIDRNSEARGRRAATAPLSFRARPVLTIPVMAYRTIFEKALYATMGPSISGGSPTYPTPTGSAPNGYLHTFTPQRNPAVLPAYHAQLVRDELNSKVSGCYFNRITANFPLDGEGTLEMELAGLFFDHAESTAASAVNDVQTITLNGGPTGGTFTVTFNGQSTAAQTYNVTTAALQTALQGLSSIGSGNVLVTGTAGASYVLTFSGTLAGAPMPNVTVTSALSGGTNPTATVTHTTLGSASNATNQQTPPTATFSGLSNDVLMLRDAKAIINGNPYPIPDLQGFSFTFNNNVNPRFYAGRNIQAATFPAVGAWNETTPSQRKKLWYAEENRVTGMQDVTGQIDFGNVSAAQEIAMDFAQIESLVFTVVGNTIPSTSPALLEYVEITLSNIVHTGGGAGDLTARDDINSSFQFAVGWDETAGYDVRVRVLNELSTRIS